MKGLKKQIILMILLLLSCSRSWCQNNDSLYGGDIANDTLVTISINYIRQANIKLIEREVLLEQEKLDSIIFNNIKQELNDINVKYEKLLDYTNLIEDENKGLEKELNKAIKSRNTFISIGISELLGIILLIVL